MTCIEVTEFTDPGCVWSWSSEPKLRWVRHRYGDRLAWRRAFGIQIDDLRTAFPGRDPVLSAAEWRDGWLQVAARTGAPMGLGLQWMHLSTRPAASAAKAAEAQGEEVADAVLRRLREAVFLEGRPADNRERLEATLDGLPALDLGSLLDEFESPAIATAIDEDFELARNPHPYVVDLEESGLHPGTAKSEGGRLRYSFPTLHIKGPAGERVVPGWRSVEDYRGAIEEVAPELRDINPAPPLDAESALTRYRSLSGLDLELLTGSVEPPKSAVRVETATAPIWVDAGEAAERDLASLVALG